MNQYTNGKFDRIANVRKIIAEHHPQFEYVRGFTNVDSNVVVRCKVCGTERTVSMITLRHDGIIRCYGCIATRKKQDKAQRSCVAESKRFNRGVQEVMHFCESCGAPISGVHGQRFCSACIQNRNNRYWNDKKNHRRVAAFTKDTHTISLRKLYERGGGVCWICGERCDYSADINDNMYPSIDHIVPISKGGKDEWSNVRLAHRICNSKRGNTV